MQIIDKGYIYDARRTILNEKTATFPALTMLQNGHIFCTFRVGPQKNSPLDKIKLYKSSDNGATWHEIIKGFDIDFENIHGSGHNGAAGQIASNALMLTCTWVDRSDPSLPFVNPQTTGLLPTKLLISFSHDDGKTWTSFKQVDTAHHPAVAVTDKPQLLQDGTILLPYESWKQYEQIHGFHSSACLLSSDKGQNWSRPVIIAEDPFQRLYFYDNRLTVASDTGKIAGLLWTHDSAKGMDTPIHINYGSPDGLEWTYPRSTSIEGQIASPLALGNNRLLMTYVHRHDPPSLRMLLSNDFGKTWDTNNELEIYRCVSQQSGIGESRSESEYWDDMARWTFGHPCLVQLSENMVLAGFYAGDKQNLSIHWIRVRI